MRDHVCPTIKRMFYRQYPMTDPDWVCVYYAGYGGSFRGYQMESIGREN